MTMAGPFGLAIVVMAAFWRPWRREQTKPGGWMLAPVVAAGYVVGQVSISSFPSFPPVTVDEWVVFAAIAAGVWGGVETLFEEMPAPVIHVGRLVVAASAFWLMVGDRLGLMAVAGLVGGVLLWTAAIDRLSQANNRLVPLFSVAFVALAAGGVLVIGASLKLAMLAWTVGVCVVAVGLALLPIGGRVELRVGGLVFLCGLVLTGLFISGVLFAQAPLSSAVGLAAVAVVGVSGGWMVSGREIADWKLVPLQLFVVALLAGGAVAHSHHVRTAPADEAEPNEDVEEDEEEDEEEEFDFSDYDDPYVY